MSVVATPTSTQLLRFSPLVIIIDDFSYYAYHTERYDRGFRFLSDLCWDFNNGKWMPPFLAQVLNDPYDAVRYIAQRSLRRDPAFARVEYDFLAGPVDRQQSGARVVDAWQARGGGAPEAGVLLDSHGALDRSTFGRLLKGRDDTSIILAE